MTEMLTHWLTTGSRGSKSGPSTTTRQPKAMSQTSKQVLQNVHQKQGVPNFWNNNKNTRYQSFCPLFLTVSCNPLHLTVSLVLCSSGSNTRGKVESSFQGPRRKQEVTHLSGNLLVGPGHTFDLTYHQTLARNEVPCSIFKEFRALKAKSLYFKLNTL